MFQGTSLLVLDAKGRLSLPAKYRESLLVPCQGEVTLTRHPDGCVLIYPRGVWVQLSAKLAALPYAARTLQRIMLGSAFDVNADASGRLLVPSAKYMQFEQAELQKGLPPEVFDLVL